MMTDLQERSIAMLYDLSFDAQESLLLAQVCLDCLENEVDELPAKLTALLNSLALHLKLIVEEMPYRVEILEAALEKKAAD